MQYKAVVRLFCTGVGRGGGGGCIIASAEGASLVGGGGGGVGEFSNLDASKRYFQHLS